jgi:hypothetical protein
VKGLCAACRHSELIISTRSSTFVLCRLALKNPRFPKYPPLPVVSCSGYEPDLEPPGAPGGAED